MDYLPQQIDGISILAESLCRMGFALAGMIRMCGYTVVNPQHHQGMITLERTPMT
jgi:hypothetical protein